MQIFLGLLGIAVIVLLYIASYLFGGHNDNPENRWH